MQTMAATNYSFAEKNGLIYCMDQNGQIIIGTFYDEEGNLYKTDGQGMLFNGRDENKQTYIDGVLINPGTERNVGINKDLSMKLESGETLIFDSYEEAYQFLEYYYGQYQLYKQICPCEIDTIYENGESKYSISYSKAYDRERVAALIDNTFGPVEGDTAQEKILDVLLKLRNMEYDISYQYETLERSLIDMKGCCELLYDWKLFIKQRRNLYRMCFW